MPTLQVTLKDRTVEFVDGADAYQQEGQMTTFFATRPGRDVVDCWSSRVASFRTSEVVIIRRHAFGGDPSVVDGAMEAARRLAAAADTSPSRRLRSAC